MATLGMRCFLKEVLANPVFYGETRIYFEPVGNDEGVACFDETTDADKIKFLDGLADQRKLGVVRVSVETAMALKKKFSTEWSARRQQETLTPIRAAQPAALGLFGSGQTTSRSLSKPKPPAEQPVPEAVGHAVGNERPEIAVASLKNLAERVKAARERSEAQNK
jgi:hypothetical protein